MAQRPFWEANSHSASQEILRLLWSKEGLLPCSQKPTNGLNQEPDESIPHFSILFIYYPFYYYFFIYV
jgi:hypothetical protein